MSRAVLFDFAGTLFDDTSVLTAPRLADAATRHGRPVSIDRAGELITAIQCRLESPEGVRARVGADCSPSAHRRVWTDLVASTPGCDETIAAACYECISDPRHWAIFPDAADTLEALYRAEVPIAVVSNIGWDLRKCFAMAGIEHCVRAFVLSCEIGAEKPDLAPFHLACERIGVPHRDALMVGDDPIRDGAAIRAGLSVYLLPATRHWTRPRGLAAVLGLVDQARIRRGDDHAH